MDTAQLKVEVTLWLATIRRKLADDTLTAAERKFLGKLYAEFARRLPD
jgi:hypothetical protein